MGLFEHTNVAGQEFSFHVTDRLIKMWGRTNLKFLNRTNQDRVYIVDGREGTGKSTFAFQQAVYLEPSLLESPEAFVSRIVFSPKQFLELARNLKNSVIIFDEAFRGMSSRAALSKTNKELVQALMEMRQQNNIVFLILPSIHLLDIYPAMFRSNGLFNIYINKKSGKRCWRYYNYHDKNSTYQIGLKKGWRYAIQSPWKGNFYNKFPKEKFEEAYLNKKELAFKKTEEEKEDNGSRASISFKKDFYQYYLYKKMNEHENMSMRDFARHIREVGGEDLAFTPARLPQIKEKLRKKGISVALSV